MGESAVSVNTERVKELREKTGAGIMECKRALEEAQGRQEEALKILRAQGANLALKKAGRATHQGLIGSYVHGGRIGVLVEINCETDFVARTDAFRELVHDVCLQVASMDPLYVSEEEIPSGVSEKERGALKERVLLNQPYVKDPSKTLKDLLHDTVASLKENIRVRRFTRFILGEELPQESSPATP